MATRTSIILTRLADGPATNAELAELLFTHSGDVARCMAALSRRGLVRRCDGGTGRGTVALYALRVVPTCPTCGRPLPPPQRKP